MNSLKQRSYQSHKVKVTIVTPAFNQGHTIGETIESVLAQTYPNIEYIVIDDGSTDNTADVLKDYKARIQIITQKNQGQAAALNVAWGISSGEYLMYLSADDILYPDCIEALVKSIDGKTLVYYPDYDLIDPDSNRIRTVCMPDYNPTDLICKLICQPGLATLFRAEAYHLVGGWNPSYTFIPDFEFWTRVSRLGTFRRIPQVLGGFRIHEDSGSVRKISEIASDEIIRFVDEFNNFPSEEFEKAAIFQSRLISARSHLQSNRIGSGIARYFQALCIDSTSALTIANIRFVVSGLVRRLYYRLKFFQIMRK